MLSLLVMVWTLMADRLQLLLPTPIQVSLLLLIHPALYPITVLKSALVRTARATEAFRKYQGMDILATHGRPNHRVRMM